MSLQFNNVIKINEILSKFVFLFQELKKFMLNSLLKVEFLEREYLWSWLKIHFKH